MRNGSSPATNNGAKRHVLITGGSGFVGANLAHRLLSQGESVLLFDNLSREGVERNYEWLRDTHGTKVRLEVGDTRDTKALGRAVSHASAVYHFAAQVAVTTSLVEPRHDFEVNALGTLNLLEAIRALRTPPPLIFTSTNKVYGSLPDVALREKNDRYEPVDPAVRISGINEEHRLDFYSPYGCSKGTADQYVLDYARTFGLPAVVFRMSCIYGPHQFGTEDQGWVAHFLIQTMEGRPITLYGDGKQVRDILFVEDLVDAFLLAREKIRSTAGQAFNIGGGPQNTTSLLELMRCIEQLNGTAPRVEWGNWRPGDQRYYVSDFRKYQAATGWSPRVNVEEGVRRLLSWLRESHAQPTPRLAAIA